MGAMKEVFRAVMNIKLLAEDLQKAMASDKDFVEHITLDQLQEIESRLMDVNDLFTDS